MTKKFIARLLNSLSEHRNQRRLMYRLLFTVVICSACFTMAATVIQLYFEFRTDIDIIERNFEFAQKSYAPAIGASVYKVNIEQLKIQLKGMLQLTDMVYVEIREPRGEEVFTLSEGNPVADRDIVREFPISYQKPSGRIIPCGKLILAASLTNVWARLWDRVIIILMTNATKMFLTSFCILLIFHYLLTRHMAWITRYVSVWNPDNPPGDLVLKRPRSHMEKMDELDKLAVAINKMNYRTIGYIDEKKAAGEALKKSEKQLRIITDSLPVLIAHVDSELHYRFSNKAYEKWFDIEEGQMIGLHVKDVIGEDLLAKIRPNIDRVLAGEHVQYEVELDRNDRKFLFGIIYVPDTLKDGSIPGFFVLAQDLSEKKQKELELQRHRDELAHVSRLVTMGELTASMAHELNQPLTAILSNAQAALRFMDKDPVDIDEIRDILTDIAADDLRAGKVIKRLRGFLSRGELLLKKWDINELIREVVVLVHSDAVIRNVSIQIDLDQSLGVVKVDRVQMQQVLLNLIVNGLDALDGVPSHSRNLTITTRRQNNGNALISVIDSGVGVSRESMKRLFEPFFTTKAEGMGMGLSINRSIIEAHDGKIWAENNPEGGTIFSFNLPMHQGDLR
jgi:PAS domain S-box-containing protein